MNKRVFLLYITIALALMACGRRNDGDPTPVGSPAPTIIPASGQAAVMRHVDLLNSPSQYSGILAQVSGQYRRLPQLVCDGEIYRSPAGWKLTAGELFIQAAGFETGLRPLANSPQTITVEGQWRRWEGLVGCGDNARPQEIWYLDVTRIIQPNPILFGTPGPADPIAMITPTPETEPGNGQVEPPPPPPDEERGEDEGDEGDDIPAPPGVSTATPTPPPTLAFPPSAGTPTVTPTATPTATPTEEANGNGNGNGNGTATPTPTATPDGNGDPPPVPLPPPGSISPQGSLAWETVLKRRLDSGAAHSWTVNVLQADTLTIHAQPDSDLNVSLIVERPDGSVAAQRDSGGIGAVETVEVAATQTGQYRVIVTAVGGNGDYAIVSLDAVSYAVEFAGNLRYGDNLTDNIPAETDQYWHFNAIAGDSVTILLTPLTTSELFIGLFGPNGALIGNFASSATVGEPAALRNVLLPTTGYYSLLIQEYFEDAANYRVQLTRN